MGAPAVRGLHVTVGLLVNEVPLGLGASESNVVPFSQSLSTLALIEEFLGKREVPPPPGAEGQGVQKWMRNVSYFREFIAALFPEPWQGLLKASFSLSLLYSNLHQMHRTLVSQEQGDTGGEHYLGEALGCRLDA